MPPSRARKAEIIAIGSELLLGGRVETNSVFLSERLAALGVEVRFKTAVGDDASDIAAAIRTAAGRADIVLLTGGLGPTCDDCTRAAVAMVTKRRLRRHEEAFEGMRRRLAVWGRVPSRAQLRQAFIPVGADVLANPVGSAPGFCLSWRRTFIAALPGVPSEAKEMFDHAVVPRLVKGIGRNTAVIGRRVLHTFGLPESDVDQRLAGLVKDGGGVRLGLLASPLGVSIVLTTVLTTPAARRVARQSRPGLAALDRIEQGVHKRLGEWIYGRDDQTLEQVVGRQLAERKLSIAVAESCTGGLIGHRLTEVPGSSSYLDRVVVSYSNRAKIELLGVPEQLIARHGAVSAEVAAAMAHGVRTRSRTDVGLSVTGIAGPEGGSERKPVGLVYIALDVAPDASGGAKAHTAGREYRFHGSRPMIKLRASQAALELLRQWLAGKAKGRRKKAGRR
jgi:nicotinamide-nucleotide amidase